MKLRLHVSIVAAADADDDADGLYVYTKRKEDEKRIYTQLWTREVILTLPQGYRMQTSCSQFFFVVIVVAAAAATTAVVAGFFLSLSLLSLFSFFNINRYPKRYYALDSVNKFLPENHSLFFDVRVSGVFLWPEKNGSHFIFVVSTAATATAVAAAVVVLDFL